MYVEIKYLNLLSTRFQKFKQKKPYLWNFRCPYCGDSQKNKNKARGFVFQLKGDLIYKCHNCQISVPLPKLIQDFDVQLYKEYRMEKFQSPKQKVDMRKVTKVVSSKPVFKKDILQNLTPLDNLNNSHPAREYILNRKLPTSALYYTEKFQEWTNSVKPNTFEDIRKDEPRIIIPFKDKEGAVFGFQGRSLCSDGLRYITILLEENQPKIFGLDTLDYEKTIYITEGPLDSLLVSNAIAMAGADASIRDIGGSDYVFVYDNEPRNLQITSRIREHIANGERVVIWPSTIKEKDINDMYLAGHDVQSTIESNTYQGLTATLKLNDWQK
jgi:hypothetical protein